MLFVNHNLARVVEIDTHGPEIRDSILCGTILYNQIIIEPPMDKGGQIPRHPKEPVVRAAFARVLADLRGHAGLTQAEVGEKSGYEEKYIGALERRKHTPTLTAVIQISKAVSVSPLDTLNRVLELLPKFAHLETKASLTDPMDRKT